MNQAEVLRQAASSQTIKPAKPAPVRWYCAACGALSSIGDTPVRKPCRCAERGDA